jgi:DNA repair exonuclease SbcCD ATPase subunit
MINEDNNENVQFKMRLDGEVEDAVIPAQVDELRIEKLSHRITLISVLIPVLIVVILVIAYIDIKRRVIRTEDTGAVTVQHLSQDLESRFSTLSLGQAHLEEALAKFQDQTNQSLAKAQVNLKKLDDGLKQFRSAMVSQKEMKTAFEKTDQRLANVAHSTEEIKAQIDMLDQSVQARLAQLDQKAAELGTRLDDSKETLANLEKNKIEKAALDLALKLEILKIKQIFNAQMDDLQAQLQTLEQKVARQSVVHPTLSPAPAVSKTPPSKAPASSTDSEKLQEQTIK